jgi:hypothetical protein
VSIGEQRKQNIFLKAKATPFLCKERYNPPSTNNILEFLPTTYLGLL